MLHAQRSLVVGNIDLVNATLYGHIHGEELPRIFEDVKTRVKLGAGYDALSVEITAWPHERDASSNKWTMPSPAANMNLRKFTGKSALEKLAAEDEAAEVHIRKDEEVLEQDLKAEKEQRKSATSYKNMESIVIFIMQD